MYNQNFQYLTEQKWKNNITKKSVCCLTYSNGLNFEVKKIAYSRLQCIAFKWKIFMEMFQNILSCILCDVGPYSKWAMNFVQY